MWIEINRQIQPDIARRCRSPHGECGLKYILSEPSIEALGSLPAWGVWIEMYVKGGGERENTRRSPHGECGLKCVLDVGARSDRSSLPAWGVWIEIFFQPSPS